MSKIIIGIHGLGNKPSKRVLEKWWKISIKKGLKEIQRPHRRINFKLVYWAHFLHPTPLKRRIKNKKDPLYIEFPYTPIIQRNLKEKPSEFRKNMLHYFGDQLDRIMLNDDLTINFSSISDFIITHFFSDLAKYYTKEAIGQTGSGESAKDIICSHLADVLKKYRKKKICLIAHSMGSIIAYDVLTEFVPDVKIDTLITIGSPLGLPVIKSKMASERKNKFIQKVDLNVPENIVSHWYNLSDLLDKIAFNYELGDDYEPNSKNIRVTDKVVINHYAYQGKKNPHKSYGYLQTPEMAEIIDTFLSQKEHTLFHRIKNILKKEKTI
ncbi:hypothetical protein JW824_06185 [bacterium]|nr:hypothetical protein [bacterium]RQV95728.1 MAG: hypothetical protein EH221_05800 [bacterium]